MFGSGGSTPMTPIQRLKNYNMMGDHNNSGLGAPDAPLIMPIVFMQKTSGSSNEDIPM